MKREAQRMGIRMTLHEDTEALRSRAHEIWMNEGCPDGRALEHWLEARREERRVVDGAQPWFGEGAGRGEAAFMRRVLWQPQAHDAGRLGEDPLVRLM
jgi:hypothetical protein